MSPPCSEHPTKSFPKKALHQWQELYKLLDSLGCEISLVPSPSANPLFVGASQYAFVTDNTFVFSYSKHSTCQFSPFLNAWIREQDQFSNYKICQPALHPDHPHPLFFSGSTDAILIDGSLYFGYGPSSAHAVASDLCATIKKPVIDISLKGSARFLIDAIFPINDGQMLCNPSQVDPSSLSYLADRFSLHDSKDPIETLPTHSIVIDNHAIVSQDCFETQQLFSSLGYEVSTINLDAFQSYGLGPRALVLPIQ